MNRRQMLAVVGSIGMGGIAGCLGEDGIEGDAQPAVIPNAQAQGYEEDGPQEIEIDETIELGGIEQDVYIRTWSAAYANPDSEAVVYVISTPDISIAGISANPLARLGGADLIARVIDQGLGAADVDGGIQDIESEGERELTVLGEQRTVEEFSAVFETNDGGAADENSEIPIRLYLLSFVHEDDVILSVGFHPDMDEIVGEMDESDLFDDGDVEMGETATEIESLMEGIEHPAE